MGRGTRRSCRASPSQSTGPGSSSSTRPASGRDSSRSCAVAATACTRSSTGPSTRSPRPAAGYAGESATARAVPRASRGPPRSRGRSRRHRRLLAARRLADRTTASEPSTRRLHDPASGQRASRSSTPSLRDCTSSRPTHNPRSAPNRSPSTRPPSGDSVGSSDTRSSPSNWGGLIDVDATADDRRTTAARICQHLLDDESEDQVAIRGEETLVPRLRPCAGLTKPFPTKLAANATYVVTGGTGALGRSVATYLAERGARHITLLSRREHPAEKPVAATRRASIPTSPPSRPSSGSNASAPTSSAPASTSPTPTRCGRGWTITSRAAADRSAGIVHTAGSVDDRLLVNMTEEHFARVMAPKVTGTRVLHERIRRPRSASSSSCSGRRVRSSPHPARAITLPPTPSSTRSPTHRRARGLPALTIGWGPWSVGMVEELKLEKIYAQRGIELITPAAGAIGSSTGSSIRRRRPSSPSPPTGAGPARSGWAGQLPPMLSDLDAPRRSVSGQRLGSVDPRRARRPSGIRPARRGDRSRARLVAAVFDCAVADVEPDETLDDIGLDSMMAMEFRVRINATFAIDLPGARDSQGRQRQFTGRSGARRTRTTPATARRDGRRRTVPRIRDARRRPARGTAVGGRIA